MMDVARRDQVLLRHPIYLGRNVLCLKAGSFPSELFRQKLLVLRSVVALAVVDDHSLAWLRQIKGLITSIS